MSQTITSLPLGKITVDPALQPRVGGLDADHVRALQEVAENWPPLVVVLQSGKHLLLDGFHRLAAAQNIGLESVPVRVETLPDDGDLHALAFALNSTHGRPLSLADRRAYARRLLCQHPVWADREIGRRCGLSSNTVGAIRLEMERLAQIEQTATRLGAKGHVYEVGTNIRKRSPGELPQVGLLHVVAEGETFTAQNRAAHRELVHYLQRLSVSLEEQDAIAAWETPDDAVKAVRLCLSDDRAKFLAKSLAGSCQRVLAVAEQLEHQLQNVVTAW